MLIGDKMAPDRTHTGAPRGSLPLSDMNRPRVAIDLNHREIPGALTIRCP